MKALYVREAKRGELQKLRKITTVTSYTILEDSTSVLDKTTATKIVNILTESFISFSPNYDIYECVDDYNVLSYLLVAQGKKEKMILLQNIER